MEMEVDEKEKEVEGYDDGDVCANTYHPLFSTITVLSAKGPADNTSNETSNGTAAETAETSTTTVSTLTCAWLDVVDLGRVEQTCKSAAIIDMVWKEICDRRFPNTPAALQARIVDKCGAYRAVAKYESTCVGRGMPGKTGPIKTGFDSEELTLMVEISVFGNVLVSERLSAREVIRGLDINPDFDYDLREPVILGSAGCMKTTLCAIRDHHEHFGLDGMLPRCSCDRAPCYFSNLIANGVSTRVDLERPNGFCCLQPPLKNAFCTFRFSSDIDGSPYDFLHTADGQFHSGHSPLGPTPICDDDIYGLELWNTVKAAAIKERLGYQNFHLYCYSNIRLNEEETLIVIYGLQFYLAMSSLRIMHREDGYREHVNFENRLDRSISLHHVLEEIVCMTLPCTRALPETCHSCMSELPKAAQFCSSCGERRKSKRQQSSD